MRTILSAILSVLLLQFCFADAKYQSMYLKERDFSSKLEVLRSIFGQHKTYPVELELECLTALSFYPELKNVKIEFKWNNDISSTMKMMPRISSFLFRKKLYYIVHMNKSAATTDLYINDLTFNAKVGWLGHELAHTLQCEQQSRLGVLWTGICHISKKFIARYERQTDIITIQHGLGYALYEGMHFTFNNPKVNATYKERLKKNYLSLKEILMWIRKVNI